MNSKLPKTMRAAVVSSYGAPEVLKVCDIPLQLPKANELLIRVQASSVTPAECELRRFDIPIPLLFWLPLRIVFGLRKYMVLGQELAGEVISVGKKVSKFEVGDRVFGSPGMKMSTHSEFITLSENANLTLIPDEVEFSDAAAVVVAGSNVLHFFRKGNLKAGEKILINGAAGVFGTVAIQIAKQRGAIVTAVDAGTKLESLKSLGADFLIDYQSDNFAAQGRQYDVIFDVIGGKPVFEQCVAALRPEGRLLMANPNGISQFWDAYQTTRKSDIDVYFEFADENIEDLKQIAILLKEGGLHSVIDRAYPLEDIVAAHKYVESGDKVGTVSVLI